MVDPLRVVDARPGKARHQHAYLPDRTAVAHKPVDLLLPDREHAHPRVGLEVLFGSSEHRTRAVTTQATTPNPTEER